jgi:uncharacterized protein
MDVTPDIPEGRQIIQAYGGGGFRIADAAYSGSVLVFPERTVAWAVTDFSELTAESLEPVTRAAAELDLLLIGCGARMELLSKALHADIREAGLGIDTMDTGAACRTFNVLLAEERRVAAALIAV